MIYSQFFLFLICFCKLLWFLCSIDIVQGTVCKNSQLQIIIKRTYVTNAEKENVALWRGEENSGVLVFFQNGKGYDSQEIQETMCIERDTYTLVLSTKYYIHSFYDIIEKRINGI